MKTSLWTPLHLNLMLHYYVSPEPYPRENSVIIEYRDLLIRDGLLKSDGIPGITPIYSITPKGKCFCTMMCDTPIPVEKTVWVDPREPQ